VKWGVLVFPGSNDDRDTVYALGEVLGYDVAPVWHGSADLGNVDAVVLPGGFSYGDYLRCGAIARFSRIMEPLRQFAAAGGPVLGICNGFQILCEAGLLPGALVRNRSLRFTCRRERIRVETTHTAFTAIAEAGALLTIPVKHGEGCYVASDETIAEMEAERRIVFRYADGAPNGSLHDIAGIANAAGNVVGLMPHPEHAVDAMLEGADGQVLFRSAAAWLERSQRKVG
jgi:phosphoribosylformylglycinamidine synthase subunit PurQ / glutaminase